MIDKKEKTLSRINQPTKLFGVSPISLICILIGIYFIANKYMLSLVLTVPISIFILVKMNRASKRGCPDYISETMKESRIKTSFIDKSEVMEKITSNE